MQLFLLTTSVNVEERQLRFCAFERQILSKRIVIGMKLIYYPFDFVRSFVRLLHIPIVPKYIKKILIYVVFVFARN